MRKLDWERRRSVWNEKALHPNLTSIEIAERLNLSERTVRADILAAERTVNESAAESVRAILIEQTMRIIAAHLPGALNGIKANADAVATYHKQLRDLFGLDSPAKVNVSVLVKQAADEFGLTDEERAALESDVQEYVAAQKAAT